MRPPVALSVLVCGVHTRYATFLPRIQKQLFDQYAELTEEDRERVEIIVLTDNKQQTLGGKRNQMVGLAQGKYVVFVDDDDRVADDYVVSLLRATDSDADCIVFRAEVTLDGGPPQVCYFSKDFGADYDTIGGYHRIPNHIACIRRSIAGAVAYPTAPYSEDRGYSRALLPYLRTQHVLDRVLYFYDYNQATTEPQFEPRGD